MMSSQAQHGLDQLFLDATFFPRRPQLHVLLNQHDELRVDFLA